MEYRSDFVSVGSSVVFGKYPQSESGCDATPIEWKILEKNDCKALLLSRYCLDVQPYDHNFHEITWEKCQLRNWLNVSFLNRAFTQEEQSRILLTHVDNSQSQGYSGFDSIGGNDTQDRVFLLSYAEAHNYLDVIKQQGVTTPRAPKAYAAPTDYAIARGAMIAKTHSTQDGRKSGLWWLRSPGPGQQEVAIVNAGGKMYSSYAEGRVGCGEYKQRICIRPAMWIVLNEEKCSDRNDSSDTHYAALKEKEDESALNSEMNLIFGFEADDFL